MNRFIKASFALVQEDDVLAETGIYKQFPI